MDVAEALELEYESKLAETKKAMQIRFDAKNVCWLPKSQVRILADDGIIYMPKWLVEANGLNEFVIQL